MIILTEADENKARIRVSPDHIVWYASATWGSCVQMAFTRMPLEVEDTPREIDIKIKEYKDNKLQESK